MNGQPGRLDAVMVRFAAAIGRFGWIVTGVGDDGRCIDPTCQTRHRDARADPYLYTVGLTAAGLPELLIEHVPLNAAGPLLNALARRSLAADLAVNEPLTLDETPGVWPRLHPVGADEQPPNGLAHWCPVASLFYGNRVRVLRIDLNDPSSPLYVRQRPDPDRL